MKRIFRFLLCKTGVVPDPAVRSLVSRVLATTTWTVAAFTALGTIGVDTTPIMAALGVTGATLGFAAKDVGANAIAGCALAWHQPFNVGTRVSVGMGTSLTKGKVERWDMRYLYLRGEKGELVLVPNNTLYNSVITLDDGGKIEFKDDDD